MDEARPSVERLGDTALLVRFGSALDHATNERVHGLCRLLESEAPPWLQDLVPSYASLAVVVDIDDESLGLDGLAVAEIWVAQRLSAVKRTGHDPASREIEIPVQYGGEAGPDLDASAAELGISPGELVARHVAGRYRVAMIGFAPGFPYLLGLDPSIALPRLATPRVRVPAGSVAIGGAQTGIYPRDSPGGWRILGRTWLRLFEPTRLPPTLFSPGDLVRFVKA